MFQTSEAQLTSRHRVKEKINRCIFLPKLPLQRMLRRGDAVSVADGLYWMRSAGTLLLRWHTYNARARKWVLQDFASSYACHFLGFCLGPQSNPSAKVQILWGVRKRRATLQLVLGRMLDNGKCPRHEDPSKARGPGSQCGTVGRIPSMGTHKRCPPSL